jgi:predicted AAA+ superfamily ATPase
MKQVIILTGPDQSGKTYTATQIKSLLSAEEVFERSARKISRKIPVDFLLGITSKTKLVIIDDIRNLKIIKELIGTLLSNYKVHETGQAPVLISPILLCICDSAIEKEDFKPLGISFSKQANVFECVNLDIQ